uniref:Protein Wnt n=1 Tax=Equus asinus TaxID=9793 RepID=A0A9L0K861_EQUAS
TPAVVSKSRLRNSTGCEVLCRWRRGSVASAGPPPPPLARGRSHPVGFLRADVGGSKRLPAPYKAVWAARAGDRAGRGGELQRAGEAGPEQSESAPESPRDPSQPPLLRIPGVLPRPLREEGAVPACPAGGRSGPPGAALASPWPAGSRHTGRARRALQKAACAQDARRDSGRRLLQRATRRRRATMRARPQLCEALLFALALQTGVCYGIKWLALSKTPAALALNQTQHCKQLEGLVSAQVQLCRSNLELMRTVVHAAREATKACRRAFSDMRWNCSSIELAPNYLLDLERGTRESAFVYALSAAAISHAIARACTTGDLPGCSCGPVPGSARLSGNEV